MRLLQAIPVAAVTAAALICWRHVVLIHWSGCRRQLRLVRREVPPPSAPECAAVLAEVERLEWRP